MYSTLFWQVHNPLLLSCGLCCTVEMVKQTDSLDFWPQTFHKGMWPWEQTHQTQANRHNWAELSRFQEIDKVLPWKRSRWESALTLDYDKTVRCCLTSLCTQTLAVRKGDVLYVFNSGFPHPLNNTFPWLLMFSVQIRILKIIL